MKNILVLGHAPSPKTQNLFDALISGAQNCDDTLTTTKPIQALQPNDIIASDGLIIFSTENFGYMNGLLKDFFERIYYPCLEKTQGMPYILCIKAGNDGTGAERSIKTITTGLRWKPIREALILTGDISSTELEQTKIMTEEFSLGVSMGIF